MPLLTWSSAPVLLLAAWGLAELAARLARRSEGPRFWTGVAAWSFRPLAVWAVANLVFRLFAPWGFNDRATYPFYFSAWRRDETWGAWAQRLAVNPEFWRWSLIALLLVALLLLLCRRVLDPAARPAFVRLALAPLVALSAALTVSFNALPEGMTDPMSQQGSFLYEWFESGNTMLYCMPHVRYTGRYMRHFDDVQPGLKASIHGVTHPPGASLALYWAGKAFGAQARIGRDRLRYALAHIAVSSLSVLAMFVLGWFVLGSERLGFLAAALWAVKPATLAYHAFAPDSIYSIAYLLVLAFAWKVVTSIRPPWGGMAGLGLALYALSWLNFNWPLTVAMFGAFLLAHAAVTKRRFAEWALRGAVPVALALALLIATCLVYRLNYIAIFRYALEYHHGYYKDLGQAYRWVMALLGGQIDIYLLSGTLCVYLFWRRFPGEIRRGLTPEVLFVLAVLGLHLAVSAGLGNGLKVEAARIWGWIAALPLVMTVRYAQDTARPTALSLALIAVSALQYYGMRLVLMPMG